MGGGSGANVTGIVDGICGTVVTGTEIMFGKVTLTGIWPCIEDGPDAMLVIGWFVTVTGSVVTVTGRLEKVIWTG